MFECVDRCGHHRSTRRRGGGSCRRSCRTGRSKTCSSVRNYAFVSWIRTQEHHRHPWLFRKVSSPTGNEIQGIKVQGLGFLPPHALNPSLKLDTTFLLFVRLWMWAAAQCLYASFRWGKQPKVRATAQFKPHRMHYLRTSGYLGFRLWDFFRAATGKTSPRLFVF